MVRLIKGKHSVIASILVTAVSCAANAQEPPMLPVPSSAPQATSPIESQIRDARATYFDNFAAGDGVKLEDRDGPVTITHYPAPKSELPADLSDIIVLGTIQKSQAFQSKNHGAIYTEITVKIENLFSLADGQENPGATLVIVMDGGALQLSDGRAIKQVAIGSGNELQLNANYVFFLRHLPSLSAYGCIKAWALSNAKAVAVASDDLARVANKTSFYNGMSESQFLGVIYALKAKK